MVLRKVRVNAGLIIPVRGNRFLFVIRPVEEWQCVGKKNFVGFGFVGGGVSGKESRLRAAKREGFEELGSPASIKSSGNTLLVSRRGRHRVVVAKQKPAPITQLSFEATRKGQDALFRTRLYLAKLGGKPKPSKEIPALIELSVKDVERLSAKPIKMGTLLKRGAKVIGKRVPENAFIFPTFSAKILGKHFGRIVKKL